MYQQGDYVVYHHDVCTIVGYEENYVGQDDYLVLEAVFHPSLNFYVPIRSLDILLRPVISKQEALDLIDSITTTDPLDETVLRSYCSFNTPGQRGSSTTNKLYDSYRQYLKKNSLQDLIPFIKLIHERMTQRELNNQTPISTDKEFYKQVEDIIDCELAVALHMDRDAIEPFIENRTGVKVYRSHVV